MGYYLNPNVWLNSRPGDLEPFTYYAFATFLAILLAATIIIGIYKKKYKKRMYFKIFNKVYNFCLGNFVIGLFLFFFEIENLPLLSARLLLLVWFIGMIVWIVFIIISFKKIPEIKQAIEKENEYKKYIP